MGPGSLFNLTVTPRCRPQAWVTRFTAAAPHCANAAEARAAGQVAAWLSGMAHYRDDALTLARKLPPKVVGRLLELDEPVGDIVDRLESNRWLHPRNNRASAELRIVAEVGGFRGFGFEFRRPPTVSAAGEGFLVSDGVDRWLLTADAFGATFHRTSAVSAAKPATRPYRITKTGVVHGPNGKEKLDLLASSSSHASSDDTLAVTLPHSHKVFLVSEAPA